MKKQTKKYDYIFFFFEVKPLKYVSVKSISYTVYALKIGIPDKLSQMLALLNCPHIIVNADKELREC